VSAATPARLVHTREPEKVPPEPQGEARSLADLTGAVVLEIRLTYPGTGPRYGARQLVHVNDPQFALRYALERMVNDVLREVGVE
jgi:hypothetical protein